MRAIAPRVSSFVLAAVFGTCGMLYPADGPDSFEVASIKYHDFYNGDVRRPGITITGNRVSVLNYPLVGLMTYAYAMESYQISGGPSWVDRQLEASFDIQAKAAGDAALTPDQARKMMRSLLAERFKLQLRQEQKELPVYELVRVKAGPKLKASSDETGFSNVQSSPSAQGIRMLATHEEMGQLAGQLRAYTRLPVLDSTGMTGSYDFQLEWIQERPDAAVPDGAEGNGASLFTALEDQLGLKLLSRKQRMDVLIIEHAEKPSSN